MYFIHKVLYTNFPSIRRTYNDNRERECEFGNASEERRGAHESERSRVYPEPMVGNRYITMRVNEQVPDGSTVQTADQATYRHTTAQL